MIKWEGALKVWLDLFNVEVVLVVLNWSLFLSNGLSQVVRLNMIKKI